MTKTIPELLAAVREYDHREVASRLDNDWCDSNGEDVSPSFEGAYDMGHRAACDRLMPALEMFENRRKLAHSLRGESPHLSVFVEAIATEIRALLEGKAQ